MLRAIDCYPFGCYVSWATMLGLIQTAILGLTDMLLAVLNYMLNYVCNATGDYG